jgi:hypothetical protein
MRQQRTQDVLRLLLLHRRLLGGEGGGGREGGNGGQEIVRGLRLASHVLECLVEGGRGGGGGGDLAGAIVEHRRMEGGWSAGEIEVFVFFCYCFFL